MKSSYRVFTVRGIIVRIHITLLFLFLLPFMELGAPGGLESFAYSLILLVVLFSSVLVHELAHSVIAIRNAIRVREITLWPLGGISSLGYIKGAWKELKISAAGPLTSLAIGFALLLLSLAMAGPAQVLKTVSSGEFMASFSVLNLVILGAYVNVILGLFNLFLPIFPMDGGRVLRSMLEMLMDRRKATKIAVTIGQSFALVFIALAVMIGSLWLVFLGVFLIIAGLSELRMTELSTILEKADLKRFITTNIIALSPGMRISEFLQMDGQNQRIFPVIDNNGRVIGVFDSREVKDGEGSVNDLMHAEFPSARLDGDNESMLAELYSSGYSFIFEKSGFFYGVLTIQGLQKAMESAKAAE